MNSKLKDIAAWTVMLIAGWQVANWTKTAFNAAVRPFERLEELESKVKYLERQEARIDASIRELFIRKADDPAWLKARKKACDGHTYRYDCEYEWTGLPKPSIQGP
jgi:hypothetical protein